MAISRLNHAVLYVRDVAQTVAFYRDVLGFSVQHEIPGSRSFGGAAFLQAPDSTNDHDLGVFGIGAAAGASPAGRGTVGLYHLAWEVQTLDDLADHQARLAAAGALVGASDHGTTKSLYAQDPDGLEFEVVWIVPAHLLDDAAVAAGRGGIRPLDIAREKSRYGGDTRGGLGISVPLGVSLWPECATIRRVRATAAGDDPGTSNLALLWGDSEPCRCPIAPGRPRPPSRLPLTMPAWCGRVSGTARTARSSPGAG